MSTTLTADTHGLSSATLESATELRVVDDPSGTPTAKKTTAGAIATFVQGQGTAITGLTAASSFDGTEQGVAVQGGNSRSFTVDTQLKAYLDTLYSPINTQVFDYLKPAIGSWTWPDGLYHATSQVASGNYATNTIYYRPWLLPWSMTISDLATSINATVASTKFALALYANSGFQPTGSPLAATGDMDGHTATGPISADITGADVVLSKGLYWAASWTDTANFKLYCTVDDALTSVFGNGTLSNVLQTGTSGFAYSQSATYNASAWPAAASLSLITRSSAVRSFMLAVKRSA